MKYALTLIFITFSLRAYSQDTTKIQSTIKFHINTRNAKSDTIKFDYYFSIKSETKIRKFLIDLTASYERDNGVNYFIHNEKISYVYGQIGNIYSEEKDMKLLYMTAHYPIKKYLKAGYDLSYNYSQRIYSHSIYLGIKWEFIDIEIAFLNKLHRIKYSIEPVLKKWKKIKLGIMVKGLYIYQRFKWQNGIVINYRIK